jgi:hypothetical protein
VGPDILVNKKVGSGIHVIEDQHSRKQGGGGRGWQIRKKKMGPGILVIEMIGPDIFVNKKVGPGILVKK